MLIDVIIAQCYCRFSLLSIDQLIQVGNMVKEYREYQVKIGLKDLLAFLSWANRHRPVILAMCTECGQQSLKGYISYQSSILATWVLILRILISLPNDRSFSCTIFLINLALNTLGSFSSANIPVTPNCFTTFPPILVKD